MIQRPRPLKSNIERRNLRKETFPRFKLIPSEVEVNKALIGSIKNGVKGAQKNVVRRTMTAAGAALPWTSRGCCHDNPNPDNGLHSDTCASALKTLCSTLAGLPLP